MLPSILLSVSDRTCCARQVSLPFPSQRSHGYRSAGILPVGPPDILSGVSDAAGDMPCAEDSAGETPVAPTDKMSVLPLQLRAEGISQPFHCSFPERATPELLKGVLAALTEIASKGFLHSSSEVAIVHNHIQLFVNFR